MTTGRQWLGRGRWASLAVLASAALWTAGKPATSSRAADKSDEAPKATASELDLIPSDGQLVISLRFADLWNHEAFKSAREKATKEDSKFTEVFVKQIGSAPDEIERVTGLGLSMESRGNWLIFITTIKPYDAKKVLTAAPDALEEKIKGYAAHLNPNGPSIAFLTDRTYAVGSAEELKQYLNHAHETKAGPLTPALRAAEKHSIVMGADVPAFAAAAPKNPPPQEAAFMPLLKAESSLLTVDVGENVKAEGRLAFAGEMDAKAGEKAANAALDMARGGLVIGLQELAKQKDMGPVVALMEELQKGLRTAKVALKGSEVEASATVKIDPKTTGADLVDAVQRVRNTASRMTSINNLKQLALAMFNYESVNGHFPADAVYDKNGKPLLSWRVMVLPYIEQDALYKQFHLNEPWDSDHNKKLIDKMPPLFGASDEKAIKNHETHYQTFVGKGTIFDGEKGTKIPDITDGTSNTIMIVEAKKTVPWSKPEDVPFEAGKLVPKLGGLFDGVFNAAFADGSVHSLPLTIKEDKLHALITRSGGEVIEPEK